jgi:outer membrane protein assembly factor BamB
MIGPGPWDWSSPAIHNGNLFIGSSTGIIYSLDALSGTINWASNIGGYPDSPMAVVNGKVYTGTHNFNNEFPTLVALDETDGSVIWTYDYYQYHNGVVGMVNSNGPTIVDGNNDGNLEVYFGIHNWNGTDNQAVCLDETTATEIWTADIGGNSTSTPAVHDGVIFIGSDNGKLYALDAATGIEKWSFQTGGMVWAAPAVADGKVFFGSHDHTFYALNEEDGSLIWSYFTGASRMLGSPAVANGMVFLGNENGKIYAFSPDAEIESLITVSKELVSYSDADGDGIIETGEETSFVLIITVTNNDLNNPMNDVTVRDRLGGELETDDPGAFVVSEPSGKNQKNRTDKLFLTWEVGVLGPGESQTTTIIVSTDINPGGHQEYSEAGIYYLNSGVSAKGLLLNEQVSATSDPIMIEVFEPAN